MKQPNCLTRRFPQWLFWLLIGSGLNACAQPYVVLLQDEDGSIGKVQVTTKQGTTVLEKYHEGTVFEGDAGKTFPVSEDTINKDFGAALAASPKKPVSFYLYFLEGSTQLTHASLAGIQKIIAEVRTRPAPDISVIGHTDTVGSNRDNELLSLARARSVISLLIQTQLDFDKMTEEWHGENNLLIPTPDNTHEPRNRRVEVTVR